MLIRILFAASEEYSLNKSLVPVTPNKLTMYRNPLVESIILSNRKLFVAGLAKNIVSMSLPLANFMYSFPSSGGKSGDTIPEILAFAASCKNTSVPIFIIVL